ncbi:MAG: tRNA nucleotidyltransferase [Clostridia bacterium]|nr:tRNA nucleotidyltransferase [Clostridia bacterium]
MQDQLHDRALARQIAQAVAERGGRAYYVGGCVRDRLLKLENKDIDIEIHGISVPELEALLDAFGTRMAIGESFGIYALKGCGLDIAMPRKEALCGTGHKDFEVFVDPFIGTAKAAQRRDFTVNALMEDVLTGEIVDHYGGISDLKKHILRHVCTETFTEDPLRVLRGAQFAARFAFTIAPETVELCRGLTLCHLPRERIKGELQKALLKADTPSIFFETLRSMDQLQEWFPELNALIGVAQDPIHHPEGDVWTHTMLVLDEAAKYRPQTAQPAALMLAALTHDFGKTICTEEVDGRIHAYGHEVLGLPLVETFLRRITGETRLIRTVLNLVELHMRPNVAAAVRASVKSTNKLFDQTSDPEALLALAAADRMGRARPAPEADATVFLQERLEVYRRTMAQPFVMGRDLTAAGLRPGPDFSDILAYAHKLRLAGVPKDSALKQTLAYARTLQKKNKAEKS